MKSIQGIEYNIEIWKEGNMFVSHAPQIDIASCGETVDAARKNIREAVELFLDETERMGTLSQVLKEAGFDVDDDKHWSAPQVVVHERLQMAY